MAARNARNQDYDYGPARRRRRWSPVEPASRLLRDGSAHAWRDDERFDTCGLSMRSCRDEEAIILCDGVIDLVCAYFNIPTRELRRTGRSNLEIAQVRQIAMYVAHVTLRLTMKQVGVGFSRDRTTVLHACHIVEDMRDDDDHDRIISHVERLVTAAFHTLRAASR